MEGAFSAVAKHALKLVEDATTLVGLEVYRDALIQCLSKPYDRDALAYFLAFDNVICRDLRSLVGEEATATLWEARGRVFAEVKPISGPDYYLEGCAFAEDQVMLWGALLGGTARTSPEKLYDLFDMRLK